MRGEAEVALGNKFNRLKFNDFILSRDLLPPTMLQQAIEQDFIPSRK